MSPVYRALLCDNCLHPLSPHPHCQAIVHVEVEGTGFNDNRVTGYSVPCDCTSPEAQ
jgi:hypothetical protein